MVRRHFLSAQDYFEALEDVVRLHWLLQHFVNFARDPGAPPRRRLTTTAVFWDIGAILTLMAVNTPAVVGPVFHWTSNGLVCS